MTGNKFISIILALTFLSGCASSGVKTRTEGAIIGGAGGATIGAIAAKKKKKGAIIGAALGGFVGLAAGDVVAKKQAAYASTEATLDNAEAAIRMAANETAAYNDDLRLYLHRLNNSSQDRPTNRLRRGTVREMQARFRHARAKLQALSQQLHDHSSRQPNAETVGLRREISVLATQRSELASLVAELDRQIS